MSQHHKTTRQDKKDYTQFRAECADQDLPCWICTGLIDYDAPHDDYQNDARFQRDHFWPASTHPELYYEPTNWRPAHAGCNRDRGNEDVTGGLGILSRQWVPTN